MNQFKVRKKPRSYHQRKAQPPHNSKKETHPRTNHPPYSASSACRTWLGGKKKPLDHFTVEQPHFPHHQRSGSTGGTWGDTPAAHSPRTALRDAISTPPTIRKWVKESFGADSTSQVEHTGSLSVCVRF